MNIALIQGERDTTTRALEAAKALRAAGHTVTLVLTQLDPPQTAQTWQAEGFPTLPAAAANLPTADRYFPRDPSLIAAHALAATLPSFDAAWFFDATAYAAPTLRERRFRPQNLPIIALTETTTTEPIPNTLADINAAAARTYARTHADLINPTAHTLAEIHQQRLDEPPSELPPAATSPAVTVCVPYFEEPLYLPEALASIAAQTSRDFTVIVMNDGSHSAAANQAFAVAEAQYQSRGWTFLRQQNAGAGQARNSAAAHATTEYLIFLDADDILMPDAVDRFLHGARITGDDCLVARNYGFDGDPNGPCTLFYDPPGNSLIGSMGDDMHGGSCMIFRRSAFLQLGGFTELRGIGFEDYELHVRANLANLRWDVLPELVYRYREPRSGGVSKSTQQYPNLDRITRWYQQRLQPIGLGQLPLAFATAYWKNERISDQVAGMERHLAPGRARRSAQGNDIKLLLLTCNFPFGLVSGWHTRVQHMIRYFGSRYQLTLVTSMPQEELAPSRKQAFTHLHAVLGVEGSNTTAVSDPTIPFRVREHYTDTFQRAVRSIPTANYHAAILDQVFMAEFRHDIETTTVLTEHNIESRLLFQASERAFEHTMLDQLPLHYQNALTEARRLERYEDRAWADFPLRTACSKIDRAEMDRRAPGGNTVLAPNGADSSAWLPNARFDAHTILFAGHLAYLPNVDAIEFLLTEIWPLVHQQKPNARLILAGRDPSPVVRAAVARAGSSTGIELVPSPISMHEVAARASITVAPLRLGSGTRLKILESMAWGLPVVSTALGAEGIDVLNGEHALIRDDAQQFAEAIIQLLTDQQLWQTLRNNSGELVRERYSWDKVFDPMNEALQDLIN